MHLRFGYPTCKKHNFINFIRKGSTKGKKLVLEEREPSYRERLAAMNLPILEERRNKGERTTTLKFQSETDFVESDQFLTSTTKDQWETRA